MREREYNIIVNLSGRVDDAWKELFETTEPEKGLVLMGKIQEISEHLISHSNKFWRLADEIWEDYCRWNKEIGREDAGK